jgi:N-acetylglucosaminyldiphosphoundecaprenol N-acetyl-beta-D-mannosaminyltransferase
MSSLQLTKSGIKSEPFFCYKVFSAKLSELNSDIINGQKISINTLNPHSFYVADHDHKFKESLVASDILLPDGVGIVMANWLINWTSISKVAGIDIFLFLLDHMNNSSEKDKKKIFFFGSSNSVLSKIKEKIRNDYPALEVQTLSPPYKEHFTEQENAEMINEINRFKPYLLFIGMTAPKQEKWVFSNRANLDAIVTCSIGAVFDFYSGRIERPGKVWQMLGLEWFGRFIREPRRLWRRYLISLPYFIFKVFVEVFKARIRK